MNVNLVSWSGAQQFGRFVCSLEMNFKHLSVYLNVCNRNKALHQQNVTFAPDSTQLNSTRLPFYFIYCNIPCHFESTRHKHMQPISYAFPKLEHARFEFQHHFSLFVVIIQNACFSVSCSRNVYFKGSLHPKPNSLAFVCAQHSLRSLSSWADFDSWRFGNNFKMGKNTVEIPYISYSLLC